MAEGDGKRRLPVLKSSDPEEEERPAAQWIVIGAVGIFIAWYPLAMLASAWAKRTVENIAPGGDPEATREAFLALSGAERMWLSVVVVIGPMIALGVASLLGGTLVGRFGGDAGKKEGTFAGVAAAIVASLLSAPQMVSTGQGDMWVLTAILLTVLSGLAARGGAAIGVRLRHRGTTG